MPEARVAAYVREPHARVMLVKRAQDEAIQQAQAFLEQLGWQHLTFASAQWDDDPQSGKAFYIYFSGQPPGEPSLTDALGGVDCIAFVPNMDV